MILDDCDRLGPDVPKSERTHLWNRGFGAGRYHHYVWIFSFNRFPHRGSQPIDDDDFEG